MRNLFFIFFMLVFFACQKQSSQMDSAKNTQDNKTKAQEIVEGHSKKSPKKVAETSIDQSAEVLDRRQILLDPSRSEIKKTAPELYRARFETSQGVFVIEVHRDWSPRGADRFYNLVRQGFYDEVRFFRVIKGFMAQFGISGDPEVSKVWGRRGMEDDVVKKSNQRGMITYAKTGLPDSRSTQLFINYRDNRRLDNLGFSPFGQVVEGMEVIDKLYGGYGEGAPQGRGPRQDLIMSQGNVYLKEKFPKLDWIKKATILE